MSEPMIEVPSPKELEEAMSSLQNLYSCQLASLIPAIQWEMSALESKRGIRFAPSHSIIIKLQEVLAISQKLAALKAVAAATTGKADLDYPKANLDNQHGDLVTCPNCGAIGILDCLSDKEITFESAVWRHEGDWFCTTCAI